MIESAMREVGAARSIVVDEDGVILAGNATVEAAAQVGMTRVITVDADGETLVAVRRSGLTPAQKTRLALFDNRTAELAEWDEDVLAELEGEGIDLSDLFRDGELDGILAGGFGEPDESAVLDKYATAVETPVYTPTGERPDLADLAKTVRRDQLMADIAAADIPDDVKAFLRLAAERHTVFNYRNVAEFYAHADVPVQRLMEDSALVIIDFRRAIELGYVRLAASMRGMIEEAREAGQDVEDVDDE